MPEATWRVGVLNVPAVAGTEAVVGLGGTPKAVFVYGTNWTTVDTAITSTGTAVYRGMAARKWDAPSTIINSAACVTPTGDANHMAAYPINNYCMNMLSTAGTLTFFYVGRIDSFDADGFTVNWVGIDGSCPAGLKVVYVALMDVDNAAGFIGVTDTTVPLGFKAGASLLHGAWGGPDTGNADQTKEFYGGAAYLGGSHTGWKAAGLTAFTFPTSASAQYNIGLYNVAPSTEVAEGGHFLGPFLITSTIVAYPNDAGSLTDFIFAGDADDGGMFVAWDDEDSDTGRHTPAASTGGTLTVSGLPFEPGLLLGYSISDEPQGQGTGGRGAVGFSVVTPDFQWTVLIDGVSSRGSFQSFQRGICDVVNGTSVHAATIDLTPDGFVATTEEDDVSPANFVWHAFGHPTRKALWIPHIYRLLKSVGMGRQTLPPPPLSGIVLNEDGGRMVLEDGSGFLEYG
jgi:hypothetical protein